MERRARGAGKEVKAQLAVQRPWGSTEPDILKENQEACVARARTEVAKSPVSFNPEDSGAIKVWVRSPGGRHKAGPGRGRAGGFWVKF